MAKLTQKITGSARICNEINNASKLINSIRAKANDGLSDYSKRVLGTEGFNPTAANTGEANVNTAISQTIAGFGANLKAPQREALNILAAAVGNEKEYARVQMTENFDDRKWDVDGYGVNSVLNTEYFSDQELAKHLEHSVVLNLRVTQQTPYAERMYRTISIDPSDTGATFRAKRLRVHTGAIHSLDEAVAKELDPRNAMDGLTDHTVLEGNILDLVPYLSPDNKGVEHFVDPNLFEPIELTINRGVKVRTTYLTFDVAERKSYLALCAHPMLVGANVLNETDEIAEGATLGGLLVNVRAKGKTLAEGSFVELNTVGRQYAGFQKSHEGDGRQLVLNFRGNDNLFNFDSKDHAGDAIPALAALEAQGYQLQYEIRFTNYLNTSTSKEEVGDPKVVVKGLYDSKGQLVESTATKAILDNIVIEAVGYKYAATLQNDNRRQAGLLADAYWFDENYKVRLGSPITTKTPTNVGEVDDSSRLEDLISLVNIRNENLAVGQTIAYTETLKDVHATIRDDFKPNVNGLTGIARHFIRPWYAEHNIDFRNGAVLTENSAQAVANARATLVDRLRSQVSVALQRSRYLTTLRASSGHYDKNPHVLITCDTVTADLLQLVGDANLLGKDITSEVVTTNDKRYYPYDEEDKTYVRRLQWVFTIEDDTNEYQIYAWGNHLWCPPAVSNTTMNRQGGIANELTVQPRNLHVVNCPITGVIYIRGLDQWMESDKMYASSVLVSGKIDATTTSTDPVTP